VIGGEQAVKASVTLQISYWVFVNDSQWMILGDRVFSLGKIVMPRSRNDHNP
jgi:hypothetical protein